MKKKKIEATPQGTNIIDIAEALKSASKNGKGNGGFPDFIAKSKDFIIVVENKSDASFQAKYNEDGSISREPKDVVNFAVNGALHYAEHIVKNTKILLPTKNGSPDWLYMEQYAKNMIYLKLKGYLEYVEKS